MTVSMQLTKRIYAGNGLTREWEVDFPLACTDDLRVFITSPLGYETQLTDNYEFNEDEDAIIYPTLDSGLDPLETGWTITLVRQTPLTQEIDLVRQGELDAEVLEQGYDKLTMLAQELTEKVDRCIKYPVSTSTSQVDTDSFLSNIIEAKQTAVVASGQAASSASSAQASASQAQQTAQTALTNIQSAGETALSTLNMQAQTISSSLETLLTQAQTAAEDAQYYAQRTLGKSVGEVYYSQSASATDNPGGLPLFTGETIATADELYPDFYTWVADHADLQISAADYETALATYGECPKYVIDTVNKTIRLPKLVNYVKMANTTDGISQSAAGLPNITGTIQAQNWQTTTTGAIASTGALYGNNDSNIANTAGSGTGNGSLSIDASRSSAIYGNSNTVTPAHTTLYPWVFAFNAAVSASVAQAAEFQTALTGKADVGLGNLTDAGEIKVAHLAMPGTEYDDLTLGASNASYTAPADGYVVIRKAASGSNQNLSISGGQGIIHSLYSAANGDVLAATIPLKKGDSFSVYYELGGTTQLFRFIYAKGAESEAA